MALGELDTDTGRELVRESVSGTHLSHTVNIEGVDDELGYNQSRIHIGGHVSVNPDCATEVVERHFGIHLDFHGQVLVIVTVHLMDEFGMACEGIQKDVGFL